MWLMGLLIYFPVLHLLKNQPPLSGDQLQGMSISMQDFEVLFTIDSNQEIELNQIVCFLSI